MRTFWQVIATGLVLLGGVTMSRGVELTISRDALERTLKQELFSGPDGRYYLKGDAHSACFISTEDPQLRFEQDRIVVRMKTRARLGVGGVCLATVTLPAEVSMEPEAEGETIGFKDASLDKVSDRKEINFAPSARTARGRGDRRHRSFLRWRREANWPRGSKNGSAVWPPTMAQG